jgi:hypothetical protein
MPRTLTALACLLVCGVAMGGYAADKPPLAHRWLFVYREHNTPQDVARTLAMLPRAKAAGYNGVALSEGGLYELDLRPPAYLEGLKQIASAAAAYDMEFIPICMPFGYAGGLLGHDKNLAEGLPVKEARYVARGGELRLAPDLPVALPGGGFERATGDVFADWQYQLGSGRSVFADHKTVHRGRGSVRMIHPGDDPAWIAQSVKVRPFGHYRVSVWIKTREFEPAWADLRMTTGFWGGSISFTGLPLSRTQDWTQHQIVFNSLNHDEVFIGLRLYDKGKGEIWWDDLSIEEIGPANILRRPGCPVTVKGENGAVYEEGRDLEPISDPLLKPSEVYHKPPTIHLTKGSRIKEGEYVRLSYFHPVVIHEAQVVGCMSEPAIYDLVRQQVQRLHDEFHPKHYFMQHDEIRVANWDQVCWDRNLTPGQMLADNVKRCVGIIHDVDPQAKVWVWSDMFDPQHNAVEGPYYLANGPWTGSWEGLDPKVGIANWAGHLEGKNLKWFSDRGHEQVLCGYYDTDDDGKAIQRWLKAAEGIPGVTGAMYTSWADKYESLEKWAEQAWGGGSP